MKEITDKGAIDMNRITLLNERIDDLTHLFKEIVEVLSTQGLPLEKTDELSNSPLLQLAVKEATRLMKEKNIPYQNGLADVLTGRMKYEEY